MLGELITEFNLILCIMFISLEKNKACALTKRKKSWLGMPEDSEGSGCTLLFRRLGSKEIVQHAFFEVG